MPSAANELTGVETPKRSMAERLASVSWQATAGSMAAFGGFAGAWGGHYGASIATLAVRATVGAMAACGFTLALLANLFAGLRRLPAPDRRIVIDAARLGRSVGDARLADPLLRLVAKKRKMLSRSATTANLLTLLVGVGFCILGAVITARVGEVLDTAVFCVLGVGCLSLAAIWPAAVAAARRNVDAAEQAALALRSEFEAPASVPESA